MLAPCHANNLPVSYGSLKTYISASLLILGGPLSSSTPTMDFCPRTVLNPSYFPLFNQKFSAAALLLIRPSSECAGGAPPELTQPLSRGLPFLPRIRPGDVVLLFFHCNWNCSNFSQIFACCCRLLIVPPATPHVLPEVILDPGAFQPASLTIFVVIDTSVGSVMEIKWHCFSFLTKFPFRPFPEFVW